jgi:molybdate transport system regulatory protein
VLLHAAASKAQKAATTERKRFGIIAQLYSSVYGGSITMKCELKLKLQLTCGGEIAMGPGKAELLRAIAQAGSISAAARAMDMSYRRAWLLVDTMNRCFRTPLVEARPGSGEKAGARVTAAGERALAAYEALVEAASGGAGGKPLQVLEAALRKAPIAPK